MTEQEKDKIVENLLVEKFVQRIKDDQKQQILDAVEKRRKYMHKECEEYNSIAASYREEECEELITLIKNL